MKRWRPLVWLMVSVVCFIAAMYFWRLGDQWQAQKPSPSAAVPSAAQTNQASSALRMKSASVKSASTAPVIAFTSRTTNAVASKANKAFPYRLSNTTNTVGQMSRNSRAILLENALIDTTSSQALAIPDSLRSHGDPGAFLVQAHEPMNDALRALIIGAGATIVSYFPNTTYLVTASEAVAAQLSGTFTVLPWEPYYKVKASLMPVALSGQSVAAVNVAVFPGAEEKTRAALQKMGVVIISESSSPFGRQFALQDIESLPAVAGLSGIELIEPAFARMPANDMTRVIMNDSVDVFVPTNYLGLSGSNILVAVADSWVATNSPSQFNPDLTNIIGDLATFPVGIADFEGHATHVGGIIAGSGLHSPTNAIGSQPGADFRGKAPAASLFALPIFNPLFTDVMLQESTARTNALISNNSWGYGTSDYNLAAASYDQAVRDSLSGVTGSQPLIYVFAAGNDGQGDDSGLGGVHDTLLSPAVGKNVLSIGASELPRNITNDVTICDNCNTDTNTPTCNTNKQWAQMTDSSDEVAKFSARGNVGIGIEGDFGRFKPDLIAPGVFVVSTRSMTWDTNAYYNPVTVDTETFFGDTVPTNSVFNYSTFVSCDAFRLDISAVSVRPANIDLPIYVKPSDFPQPPADLIGTNFVSIPNGSLSLAPVDTFWYYSIGNPTNVPVTIDVTSQVTRTNELGDYWDILRTNLNDQLISSNGQVLYRYESGTSMAAPAVAGTLALMEDFFKNRWNYTPSPALMKALLISGARSINSKYDFQINADVNSQGWGLVNLTNSLPPGITNLFGKAAPMIIEDQDVTNALATGDTRTLFVQVNSNAQTAPLRITLVWTDPPGNPAASIKLVNNLDLIVTNLDSVGTTNLPVVFFGNNFPSGSIYTSEWDGNTNNLPLDNVNNVENVYIPGVLGTNYSITIVARNVNVNALTAHTNGVVQDYALVISSSNGEFTNALTLTDGPPVPTFGPTVSGVTNQFADSTDTSGGLLTGQHVGASSPLQGTNAIALTNQFMWGPNGQITLGVTNQWHFYVVTNSMGTNATTTFTNAAFATFLPPDLSISQGGANGTDSTGATRPEADIDLYVARGPNAWALTNLDPTVIAAADKSLTREGTEFIVYSNAQPNEVFYIGVKAEDQQAAEYDFLALFSQFPFSQTGPNGEEYLRGMNVPTIIPDGTPNKPGIGTTIAIGVQPIEIRRVVVTNDMEHENFGDLLGTLIHNRINVVLNNHTFGNGTTNQEFIYEDNDEGDVPGSQHPDGPGKLQDFIGEHGLGLWLLREQDNALFNTGRVDHVFIRIDPQQGTNGVVATIPPGGQFIDFIDVPPEATNLTVFIDFLNGSLGPVQLYLRHGDVPSPALFDYTKSMTAPTDSLTVGRSDLPPLRPGRYYVLLKNNTALPQTVRLRWSFGLDPNGANPTPITSINSTSLPDDATTNNSIFITNNQNIVTINVGVVLKHPRVSDLDLTLISPEGQRILLFENRGGPSATNMGHLNITTNFFGSQSAGDFNASTNVLSPVPNSGVLIIDYNFHEVADSIDVYYDGVDIFSPGLVSNPAPPVGGNPGTFIIPYGPGASTSLTIVINQGGNSLTNTAWEYTPRVVTEDFTYLTFTDNTNLTEIPIKFAVPPYDALIMGTNFALSDFELATNGQYIPPGTTNIADLSGGWLLTTNDVFIRTNYFAGTNLLSMATNEVSVVTDPATAASGSNYLALANGSISRNISLASGKQYTINYVYRGPGIAGWWRGEGNATDSSDPETLGNNGNLIGRFNFPAGEVGQAFALEDSGLAFQFAGTNTYVQIHQSGSLDVGAGSGFTVEGWINPTNTTFQQPLVEWLARVPTNSVVNGQNISNFVVQAGPFLNRANGHYYYLLGQTNWATSELWANALGGHLAEIDDANEQNWIYDTFAQFAGSNYTMWIGLTNNNSSGTNFVWSTGAGTPVYTNWSFGQPTNCATSHFVAILGPTNGLPGLWTVLDNNGLTCNGNPANKPLGVVEVNQIQTNGVQFWISVTNATTPGNGRLYANIYDTNGVPHELFSSPGLIKSNVYQHVALTYNTNTGVAKFYYAGTNVTTTNIGVFVPKTGGDVLLGKDMSRATNNFFWGRMDEMSIYSRFLSPAEIAAIYRISATTSNRNIGKFDPAITPSESLGEAQVSFNGVTNLIFGNNRNWQVQGFTLQATSNSVPLQFTGLEPGILLDSFNVAEHPPGNLYYLPEQPLQALVGSNAFGNWTLEIRDARTGAVSTNAELESWQLQFILETNIAPPIAILPQGSGTNTVPPGQIAYFTIFVPSWANFATNILVSATAPVDLLFNQNNPPGTGAPGDFTFLNNSTGPANRLISAVPATTPPLIPGQTYYLGVQNNGAVPSTVVVQVNFNITTLTNGIPLTSRLDTNDVERPFIFNVHSNATEATFQLLQLVGNADLVLRKGLPLPGLLNADYGSFSGSNADETIYVLTNSLPVPLSAGLWYLDVIKRGQTNNPAAPNAVRYAVLAKELTNAPQIINLTNRVPLNFTVAPGAALTNFFRFSVTNLPLTGATNLGIHFEVFNQSGNGDLTVQTNALPLAPPFLQSSRLPRNNAEIIFIRTNSAVTNLNADWYLGVPNNETNPISFTILAEIDTNSFAAFPTAEGSGAYTRGGALSTSVYHVTTLFDSGSGSLRAGVNSLTNGGTIVFDVSGSINLSTPLFITNSFLTIAGQTAPSNGVTVAGAPTYVQNAHDIIMRYLRFRPSSSPTNPLVWSGSFEGGVGNATYYAPANFGGGWHIDSGSIDLFTNGPPFNAAPYDGAYYIDISGVSPAHISTNITTIPGATYSVGFAYTKDPNASTPPGAAVSVNGTTIGSVAPSFATSFSALDWHTTSFVFTATSPLTALALAAITPSPSGVFLDAVTVTLQSGGDSLQFTNVGNAILDHVSMGYGSRDNISVLNSSNITVQWSVMAESQNTANVSAGGSEIRYGSGDVTFHHNLYADNYSGNPTIGENVSLDFVNNVVFNWGILSGSSTNDLANNPGGLTNFLNYSANYLIAGSNSAFPDIAFRSGTANTWIFQTNNVIDTNRNNILDGANTSWGMFSNPYTPFSHAFDIPPPTAPDEAFIAYEKVLDFAGTSLFSRDLLDRGIVQRVRLQPANTNVPILLSGMSAWWKAENNANDSVGANNGAFINNQSYASGEVNQSFNFDGASYVQVPDGPDLRFTNVMTIEAWINLSTFNGNYNEIVSKFGDGSLNQDSYTFTIEPGGHLRLNVASQDYSSSPEVLSSTIIPTNQWVHVAGEVDGTALKVYVNGQLSASIPSAVGIFPSTLPVTIGATMQTGPVSFFNGKIDELSLYKRALSDCEIAAIYNAGPAGKQSLLSSSNVVSTTSPLPYADVDKDGIPDFWEITLNESPTNFSPNLDRDGDGYTDLEEYLNWLGVPHAAALHNTSTNVDLYTLSGNTGNLLFGVANGTNGSVYLTNANACLGGSPHIAVFTPASIFGNGTNSGFGSFTYMVTNTDTMAYFGPVTVSVFVSAVQITNISTTNILIFTNPPDIVMDEMTTNTVANPASPTNGVTYILLGPPTWATIDPNTGLITLKPLEPDGPTNVVITTVATDSSAPPIHATNTFSVTVNEVNRPPVFIGTPPNMTNSALVPITVTNAATDPDIPINPLTYQLLNPPLGATIDTNTGIISWTPTAGEAPGLYTITTVVTDTNALALNNNSLSATNTFTVFVFPAIGPFAFTQPAQAVTGTSAQLNGMATPNGLPTLAWFEWGTNTLYGNQTTPVNVGASLNVVYTTNTIAGLIPNVPYHFRLVVSNSFVGIVPGFDQILDEARIVAWGADYVKQIEVPPGLSNIVAIAGAYDHSLALKNNGTVVAWGDNTFGQTNVPAGLNNVLAVAGGQYSSIALKNNGTVTAWGGNILSVTNVPAGLNNVVMIAGGTYASLALKNSGAVVSWGANFFSLTNLPAGLNNVVEVAGGSYHSLAIRNDGTVVAWGDNSAGQTNVPPSATNVVAIAGGNYHSLALRSDGTVVAWGDNSSGQTNVPPGLSNVVAVAAGGFHSMVLKSDGTVVSWGDNTAGQSDIPAGLSNVVAISSGYFHSLALTPTLLSTNPIVLNITNGVPRTNTVLGDSIIYYRVDVPADADAATNTLLFALNGPLNVWYSTNTPPTTGLPNDFQLLTNVFTGTSVVDTATSPQLIAGKTYYLGLQNTNGFAVNYVVQVDFHFVVTGPLTNTVPISTITHTNINGTNGFLLVWFAPTNDLFQVQWSPGLPPNWTTFTNIIGYHTFINPTNSEFEFFDDGSQTGGSLGFGRFYRLILLGSTPSPTLLMGGVPVSNSIPSGGISFYQVNVPTNADFATNLLISSTGPLNVWFSTNNPPTITNSDDFLLITNLSSGFSTLSGTSSPQLIPGGTYYLGVQNTNVSAVNYAVQVDFHLTPTGPTTNSVPISTITRTNINGTNGFLLVWFAPTNALFQVQWTAGLPPSWTTFTNIIGYHTFINPTNSEFEFFDDGSQTGGSTGFGRLYRLIQLGSAPVTNNPPTNPVPPISSISTTNIGGTNNFLLVWFAPTNELFQVQWSAGLPPSWFTFTNIISYNTFISATNSKFIFLDDGSQTGGFGTGRYYRLIPANSTNPSLSIIPLANGVPVNFTTAGGETNFFSFDITQTNAAVLFELYNLTGNGDLTLQRSSLPVTAPYFTNSSNPGTNYEQIVVRTNASLQNINAVSWFLGVPNQTLNPISYTIRAVIPTNGILVSGLPLGTFTSRPGGTNVQLVLRPTINGEKYEIRTNSSLTLPNWGAITDLVASGTSTTFTDPSAPGGASVFYWVVQVP